MPFAEAPPKQHYACRARGSRYGLRITEDCGRIATYRDRWCSKHHRQIRDEVRARKTTWDSHEKGLRRKRHAGVVVGTRTSLNSKSAARLSGTEREIKVSGSVKKRLRALGQEVDPRGVPGTYSEGVLRSTRPYILDYPEIHSCLWLWPDGKVRNVGPEPA